MTHRIFSHTYPNGLVLVAEPTAALQSAAFTFLVPAGCVYDPADRGGLSSFTCEMSLRGAGERDSRQFILDLDNLGVERAEGVSSSHASYSGATVAENLPKTLAIYADLLRRPHLPEDQLEASRLAMLQELRAVEDEPGQKVMIELRRRHYPEPWGLPAQGDEAVDRGDGHRRHSPALPPLLSAQRHDSRRRRPSRLAATEGRGGRTARRLARRRRRSDRRDALPLPLRALAARFAANANRRGLRERSLPPSRLLSGVRGGGRVERRHERPAVHRSPRAPRPVLQRLCQLAHALASRRGVLLRGTGADRAQETLDVILGELRRLAEGITEAELDRLKARIKSALIMQQESSSARSSSLAHDWYHLGRARAMDEVGQLVDGLSSRSINAYLAEHPPADFTVVTLGSRALEVLKHDGIGESYRRLCEWRRVDGYSVVRDVHLADVIRGRMMLSGWRHCKAKRTVMIADYQDVISVEPGKRYGKPCVRGMRITVYDVLSYLAAGMSHEQVRDDFPELTEEDILACLSYAAAREQQMLVGPLMKLLFDQNLLTFGAPAGRRLP